MEVDALRRISEWGLGGRLTWSPHLPFSSDQLFDPYALTEAGKINIDKDKGQEPDAVVLPLARYSRLLHALVERT